jgi:uncharacterized membrane protein YoaK (UPF0700 family)
MKQVPQTVQPDKWLSFGLAFVGGYGDAAGFVLAKTFTGHFTGNLVLAAVSIAARDWRTTIARIAAIVCFLAGILLSVLVARLLAAWPSRHLLPAAMGIEVVLMVTAYLALAEHAAAAKEVFVICFSLALGLQNGAFRRTGGISVHTTYMTGMITALVIAEAEKMGPQSAFPDPPSPEPKLHLIWGIWIAFFLGAGAGASVAFHFEGFAILAVAFVLLVLIVHASRHSRAMSAP